MAYPFNGGYYNPYQYTNFQNQYQPVQSIQPMQPRSLQGRQVDSLESARVADIPLDRDYIIFPVT